MKIFMARHGQTDYNVEDRIQGNRVDGSLNEEGRRQAEDLAQSLRTAHFDVIYCSPLKRARETAEAIARVCKSPIVERDELKERDFGSLTGIFFRELPSATGTKPGELIAIDTDQRYDYRPYGGESAEDVQKRLMKCIEEIKKTYQDKKVLIVAHAGILRLSHLLFRETKVDHIKNVTLEEFEI